MINLITKLLKEQSLPDNPEEIHDRLEFAHDNLDEKIIKQAFDNYKRYCFSLDVLNIGTDTKFIKSENRKVSLFNFLNRRMHLNRWVLEKTPFVEAMFGDRDFYELVDKFNKINDKLKKKRAANLKKYGIDAID